MNLHHSACGARKLGSLPPSERPLNKPGTCFSPDGRSSRWALPAVPRSWSRDCKVVRWGLGPTGERVGVAFSRDGKRLAVAAGTCAQCPIPHNRQGVFQSRCRGGDRTDLAALLFPRRAVSHQPLQPVRRDHRKEKSSNGRLGRVRSGITRASSVRPGGKTVAMGW